MTKWWLTSVYGLQEDADKILFLEELEAIRAACPSESPSLVLDN
jgi:hypothetical protein